MSMGPMPDSPESRLVGDLFLEDTPRSAPATRYEPAPGSRSKYSPHVGRRQRERLLRQVRSGMHPDAPVDTRLMAVGLEPVTITPVDRPGGVVLTDAD